MPYDVYVGNIDILCTEQEVKSLFYQITKGSVIFRMLYRPDSDANRRGNFGFVTVETLQEMYAITSAMNGYKLRNRHLKVNATKQEKNFMTCTPCVTPSTSPRSYQPSSIEGQWVDCSTIGSAYVHLDI